MSSKMMQMGLVLALFAATAAREGRGQQAAVVDEVAIPLLAQAEGVDADFGAVEELAGPEPAPAAEEPVVEEAPVAPPVADELIEEDLFAPIVAPAVEPAPAVEDALPAPIVDVLPAAVAGDTPPPAVEPPADPAAAQEQARLLAEQMVVRLREQEIRGKNALAEAQAALARRNYKEAAPLFQQALDAIPVRPETQADREQANRGLSEAQFNVIQDLIRANQLAQALELATAASKRDKTHRGIERQVETIQEKIADEEARRKRAAIAAEKAPPSRSPVVQQRRQEVERLVREGRGFLAIGDNKTAGERFMSALSIDPENKDAMRYLERTGERSMQVRTVERAATSAKMIADVRGAWNPGDYDYVAPPPVPTQERGPDSTSALIEKMEKIVIPQIEFRQANMNDVVDFLQKASIAEDRTTDDPDKKGVNIILNLGQTAVSAGPARPADPFGDPGGIVTPVQLGVPEITFSARFISLYSALKIITSVANLKFRIENQIVMIVPADSPDGTIETKWYSVQPGFMDKIRGMSGGVDAAAPTDPWGGGGDLATRVAAGGGDVEQFFRRMGVEFPKGSSIVFQPALSKLVLANTEPNHARVERILREIDVPPKQVEIEARFVEVNQMDLEELGFQWMLNDNWEMLTKKSQGNLLGGQERVVMHKNSDTMGFTRGLRFMDRTGADLLPVAGGGMGAVMKIQSVLTNPDISMILHVLEQNGRADVLSAPKVTTKSGNEATIRVVTEYIYPTDFDIRAASELVGTGGGTAGDNNNVEAKVVALPQNFETREVGVILSVIPQVSEEGNMIDLNMRPEVVSEPTWYEYGVTLPDSQGNEYQVKMPQPFFHRRAVETQISIYDGATVVMGGLITEKITSINDKIPFLGDLPLIGFLFRNKGQESQKRNLLIFVTARLVDPAGKPIRSQTPGESMPVSGTATTSP